MARAELKGALQTAIELTSPAGSGGAISNPMRLHQEGENCTSSRSAVPTAAGIRSF